jgi:trimethylamine--corrinoid protein Co-methyltransferase
MRYCTPGSGAIEAMMLVSAYAQVAKHYGLPTSAYTGDTDSKNIDAQAGFESGLGIVLATLAGVNIVSGPGGMNFLNIQSLEKLIVDDAICGMAQRLKKGIIVSEETLAHDAIKKAGPGGHYLNLRHTLEWIRKEQFVPRSVVDRQSIEAWKAKGSRDSAYNAAQVADRLLQEHTPETLAPDTERRLDDAMKEMMKRRGL